MSEIRPAATVVLIHDSDDGLQALLLRRNTALDFAAGSWVFPGGKLETADYQDENKGEDTAARQAAVRETTEEAGLVLNPSDLLHFAHWTTPPQAPKRFATWFFVCAVDEIKPVTVDGSEITDHLWARPSDALAKQSAGEVKLMPPTFVTLLELSRCDNVAQVQAMYEQRPVRYFQPHFGSVEGGVCMLYSGDAGYEASDPNAQGARHRFWMIDSGWRYENSFD